MALVLSYVLHYIQHIHTPHVVHHTMKWFDFDSTNELYCTSHLLYPVTSDGFICNYSRYCKFNKPYCHKKESHNGMVMVGWEVHISCRDRSFLSAIDSRGWVVWPFPCCYLQVWFGVWCACLVCCFYLPAQVGGQSNQWQCRLSSQSVHTALASTPSERCGCEVLYCILIRLIESRMLASFHSFLVDSNFVLFFNHIAVPVESWPLVLSSLDLCALHFTLKALAFSARNAFVGW